jgi:hypothetical protein
MSSISDGRAGAKPGSERADYLHAERLDLTPAQVRSLYPWATELISLDGRPCWWTEDLEEGQP